MIKVSKGPMIERYALIYGCDIEDVLEWMNDYINHPEKYQSSEKTPQERLDGIKGYIEAMIKCSTYGRIKQALDEVKKQNEVGE